MTGAANPVDWIEKARQDLRSARRLLVDPPELEDAAYHVQQGVEKAIKSVLVAESVAYPRRSGQGHDINALAVLVPVTNPAHAEAQGLTSVTPWSTAFRYPSDDPVTAPRVPTKQEIEARLADADAFVEAVARRLTPPGPGRP